MNQLQTLIQKGESEHLEFKTSFGKEAIEALCAFANTRGGTVLIGINDKGRVAGVQASRESIQKWINQIKNSTIKIFHNRMEFFNPGPLPKGMKMQDILSGRMASNPRNKQIASIFKEAGIIEKYGSGIKRVMQSMADAGSPAPVFEIIADTFKVTLFPIGEIPGGGVSGGVSGGVNNLLDYIKANPGKKSKEIKAALNLPQRTLERWLKELREQKKIKFLGAPKTGGYYCFDEIDPTPVNKKPNT